MVTKKLFPSVDVIFNHKHKVDGQKAVEVDVSCLVYSYRSNFSLQFSSFVKIFIPSLALALEYNGEYHYKFVPVYHVTQRMLTLYSLLG